MSHQSVRSRPSVRSRQEVLSRQSHQSVRHVPSIRSRPSGKSYSVCQVMSRQSVLFRQSCPVRSISQFCPRQSDPVHQSCPVSPVLSVSQPRQSIVMLLSITKSARAFAALGISSGGSGVGGGWRFSYRFSSTIHNFRLAAIFHRNFTTFGKFWGAIVPPPPPQATVLKVVVVPKVQVYIVVSRSI